jgi:hypothetical protein
MGFRDVRKFNLAMLGKQGRRIMSNPSSLCARFLKGRYFSDGEFLTARKKNSSHTWRDILAGRVVLEKGLIWRIGDGSSTDIWRDKWIQDAIGMKPICRSDGAQLLGYVNLQACKDLGMTGNYLRTLFLWTLKQLDAFHCLILILTSGHGQGRSMGFTLSDQHIR